MSAYEPMEAKGGQKGDDVDALFDEIGLTSADARKEDIYTGMMFMNNASQTFSVKKIEENYYTITNKLTGNVLTVEGAGKKEGANVIPAKFNDGDNQKFAIVRDTVKYRYGAFIIAKHSGMALTLNDKGSVVQKKFDPNDKSQVWGFSYRMVWKNDAGYLGLKKLGMFKEDAVLCKNDKTASWSYIAHPASPNVYYIMNSKSKMFLMTEEVLDKNNAKDSYKLVQSPYTKGTKQVMLFYMVYSDETKTKVKLVELTSKYVVDVDKETSNLILVPSEKASTLSAWGVFKAPGGF
jgi:hypothetical protein